MTRDEVLSHIESVTLHLDEETHRAVTCILHTSVGAIGHTEAAVEGQSFDPSAAVVIAREKAESLLVQHLENKAAERSS